MDSNNKCTLKLEKNNLHPLQAEGSLTKSKEDVNNKKDENENKVFEIIVHNTKAKKKIRIIILMII